MRVRSWVGRSATCCAWVAFIVVLSGCSSKPLVPSLVVDVLDHSGRTASGARVSVRFPDPGFYDSPVRPKSIPEDVGIGGNPTRYLNAWNNPLALGAFRLGFGLPNQAMLRIVILDRAGRPVRTLADRAFPAGAHIMIWDATDDANHTLPNGMYEVFWSDQEGDSLFIARLAILVNLETNLTPNWTADRHGRVFIPLRDLPVGLVIDATDAAGSSRGNWALPATVQLCAEGDNRDAHSCTSNVPLGDLDKSVSVTVRLN